MSKFRKTQNSIYAAISNDRTTVSLEIALRKYDHPVVKEYEKTNGSSMEILTLLESDLLVEKLNAYCNRKLIRDIYDVYHLSRKAELNTQQREKVKKLLTQLPQPIDETNLPNLVLNGTTPSFSQMTKQIKQRLKS